MSLSTAHWPPQPLPQPIKDLISKFYTCVDSPLDPTANTILADEVFLPNATFTINQRVISGRDEIVDWRGGAASGNEVAVSIHTVEKIYILDEKGKEILTTGTLYLEMKDGKRATSTYAAKGVVDDVESRNPRLREWQGWCDYMPFLLGGLFEAGRIYGGEKEKK